MYKLERKTISKISPIILENVMETNILLQINGLTVEEGSGEKSIDNPYTLSNLSGDINIQIANEEESSEYTIPLEEELYEGNRIYFNKENSKWQIEKVTASILFNGTEEWSLAEEETEYSSWICNSISNVNSVIISNKLSLIEEERIFEQDNKIGIRILKSRLEEQTESGLKNWLSSENILCYYKSNDIILIDCTETQINALNSVEAYLGYNLISFSNENGLNPILTIDFQPELNENIINSFLSGITRGYIKISGTDIIFDENNYLKDIEQDELRFVPDKGFFGETVAKSVRVNFVNVDNMFTIEDKDIEVYLGADYKGETYYIFLGNYIVQHPENEGTTDNTSFEGLDYMVKFNPKYVDRIEYPCTLLDLAKDVCEQAEVELGHEDFRNADFIVENNQFTQGESLRDVIKSIAMTAFSWARIGVDNKLYFDFNINTNPTMELGTDDYFNLNYAEKEYGPINRIRIGNSQIDGENVTIDDEDSIAIYGIHELRLDDNPLAYTQEKREQIIEAGRSLFGFTYRPLNSVKLNGFVFLDCTDTISITSLGNQVFTSYLLNHTRTYNGVTLDEIQSPSLSDIETKYAYKPSLGEAYKNTQIIVDKHEQEIKALVEKSDGLASQLTKFYQDLEKFQFSVQNSGGNNLIKNSVGWAELNFWEVEEKEPTEEGQQPNIGIITNKSDEIVKNTLGKSAFIFIDGKMQQSFEVEEGKSYSIGFKIKKSNLGVGSVKVYDNILIKEFNFEKDVEYNYDTFQHTFTAQSSIVTIELEAKDGVVIADLIANTGDILSQWQPYAQELYALGVQIDSNGIKTYDNVSGQEVHLLPTGLSGYYNNEEVFTLNKDITQTKKFFAKDEIDMPPIKIITTSDGWDFVYED